MHGFGQNEVDCACTEKKQVPGQHNLGKHLQINRRAVDLVTFAVNNLPKQLLHLLLVQVLLEGVHVDAQNALPLSFLQAQLLCTDQHPSLNTHHSIHDNDNINVVS